jgi:hypothetical protein
MQHCSLGGVFCLTVLLALVAGCGQSTSSNSPYECRTLSSADLKPGQRVQVQSTGTATQSYPPQIQATEVVILPSKA